MSEIAVINDNDNTNFAPSLFWLLCEIGISLLELCSLRKNTLAQNNHLQF